MAVEGYEGLGDKWRLLKLMEGITASGKEIVEVLIVCVVYYKYMPSPTLQQK